MLNILFFYRFPITSTHFHIFSDDFIYNRPFSIICIYCHLFLKILHYYFHIIPLVSNYFFSSHPKFPKLLLSFPYFHSFFFITFISTSKNFHLLFSNFNYFHSFFHSILPFQWSGSKISGTDYNNEGNLMNNYSSSFNQFVNLN